MGILAAARMRPDDATRARLASFGIALDDDATSSADAANIAAALALGADLGVLVTVADRRGIDRAAAGDLLVEASAALAGAAGDPLGIVVLPASLPVQPGPVAVVSPAGSASTYELYVGAAIAAASGRRVEHLNGRGTQASAVHSGIAGRVLARAAAPAWHETTHAHPERALHTLASRPAAIVVAVPPDTVEAARLLTDHADADVLLVFDRAHARHGLPVAQQVAAMIELAFSLGADTAPAPTAKEPLVDDTVPPVDPAGDLPSIRASDVVHVRLTDQALELTNRTAQSLRAHVSLGADDEPERTLAAFETVLAAGESVSTPTNAVAALAQVEPPVAVMRHWSHESEEVYEGGRRRILAFRLDVLDDSGDVRASRTYRPGNGLDFFVTARDLMTLIQRPVARSVLPEPAATPASSSAPRDLLGALASAVAVGAGVLAGRPT